MNEIHRITVVKWENIYPYGQYSRVVFYSDPKNNDPEKDIDLMFVYSVKRISVAEADPTKYFYLNPIVENGETVGYWAIPNNAVFDAYPYENIKMFSWKRVVV